MNIINKTKRPIETLKELIKFACGLNVCDIPITIDIHRGCFGSSSKYFAKKREILIRIPADVKFPAESKYNFKTCEQVKFKNWQEFVVAVTAHELQHYIQHKKGKRFSESEAEIIALARLKEFRNKYINFTSS